jgi:hypothetical protein
MRSRTDRADLDAGLHDEVLGEIEKLTESIRSANGSGAC